MSPPRATQPQAVLVLPHLRVQNANAISSPLTHGFPSITAFTGLMWALERKLVQAGIALQLLRVGVICHAHDEQVVDGYVKTFRLTRNPVGKDGKTAAIVEEGRIHLDITLVFGVAMPDTAALIQATEDRGQTLAQRVAEVLATMRIAGGTVLPTPPTPGRRTRPWLALLPEDAEAQVAAFKQWRRQWLPGYALVGRDDLLAARLAHLQQSQPEATLLDAWLHAARFNHAPITAVAGEAPLADGKVRWADPLRGKGAGWTVPIPVGYASLTGKPYGAGEVAHARDMTTPLAFVESVYSLGEWISPHRLQNVQSLFWHAEADSEKGLYRCRSGYVPPGTEADTLDDDEPDFD
ncbi:MAG: type I-F CRISPR-associated protein Csy2 [Burkholderiaceae bacterium]|nr:type I-F CRISPR-associated protein Csy2 [Burkholderiaceae bacterium]